MALTDEEWLRSLVGESILPGGTESDTLFLTAEIDNLLDVYGTAEAALGAAWGLKAAKLSDLVDTTEGSTNRRMSQAFDHAVKMASSFGGVGGRGATVIHRIER